MSRDSHLLYLYASLRITSVASTSSLGSILSANLVNNPTVWVEIVLYLSLAPTLFFWTLGAAHKAMNKAKQEHLKVISGKLNDEYKAIYENLRSTSAARVPSIDSVKNLHELYRLAQAFPVWPFDFLTMRRFIAAVFAPIVTVIGSASIEVFVLQM